MTPRLAKRAFEDIRAGFDPNPARAVSAQGDLRRGGVAPRRPRRDRRQKLAMGLPRREAARARLIRRRRGRRAAGAVLRDGEHRAFCNVCKHRAHALLSGEGRTSRIMCPCHPWVYGLDGRLVRAPRAES